MTISNGDEAEAAMQEMAELIAKRPALHTPEARRLLWLTKELKDWLLDETGRTEFRMSEAQRAYAREIWLDINEALSGWHG